MLEFKDNNPLAVYEKDIFIKSGKEETPIYVFKFAKRGAKVDVFWEKGLKPMAKIQRLWFGEHLFWDVDKDYKTKTIIEEDLDIFYQNIADELEVIKFGSKRKNS